MRMVRAYLAALDPSLARDQMLSGTGVDDGAPITALRWSLEVLR
jgi:hypothetical protein